MFRKHAQDFGIVLRTGEGERRFTSSSISFEEDGIIRASMEFYNDPQPCEIHRAAVRNRALADLKKSCPPGRQVPVGTLPELLRAMLPMGTQSIEITGAQP